MKAKSYITLIRAQVKADHGKVPTHLGLTIQNYASALETRDLYREQIAKDGVVITKQGSNFNMTTVQHPLCNLLYQQEVLCLNYAKALGLSSAKQAAKPQDDAPQTIGDNLQALFKQS